MRLNKPLLAVVLTGALCAGAIAGARVFFAPEVGNSGRDSATDATSSLPDKPVSGEGTGRTSAEEKAQQATRENPGMTKSGAVAASPLSDVERMVRNVYADVAHLPSSRLGDIRDGNHDVVLIDAREADEYEISHIDGAIRVNPDIWSSTFLTEFGTDAAGKTFVFYCSVGVRSSKLAGRVQGKLKELGAAGVYNLEGGIFRWHNEQRTLVDAEGATQLVHKYDDSWGRLVSRQDLAVTQP